MSPSWRLRLVAVWCRRVQMPLLRRPRNIAAARARVRILSLVFLRGRRRSSYRTEARGGVPCRVLQGGPDTLFLVHGGAFALFSARTHQGVAARLAGAAGMTAVLPEYRLAPEHGFPCALDDVCTAYLATYLATLGRGRIVLAGDSAGGNLIFALLHRLIARGLPLPAAVVAFSPFVDLALTGESFVTNAGTEALLPASRFPEVVAGYAGAADPADPEISPVYGTFTGAPPCLIQVGDGELLLSDAVALAERLRAQGAPVTLDILPGGLHAFQLLTGWLPEADAALDRARRFIRQRLREDRASGS
ncbi:alpha/beta hydrolase [Anianabacter salinae]|uniref:alpha/beta hydrolase n=1 Tax=Anianabacter salinae TaxID=2851023 RepID=UPI00225DF192|nr:alpha/beta hydrolase [Anianabacter salinae]MBV0913957.1 alpha/beta hydrolase [Anianabacter salinae]